MKIKEFFKRHPEWIFTLTYRPEKEKWDVIIKPKNKFLGSRKYLFHSIVNANGLERNNIDIESYAMHLISIWYDILRREDSDILKVENYT